MLGGSRFASLSSSSTLYSEDENSHSKKIGLTQDLAIYADLNKSAPTKKEAKAKSKPRRSCLNFNDHLDWTMSNLQTSGTKYGHKRMGNGMGAPTGCSLM